MSKKAKQKPELVGNLSSPFPDSPPQRELLAFRAMEQVLKALRKLSTEERQRVMKAIWHLLEVAG